MNDSLLIVLIMRHNFEHRAWVELTISLNVQRCLIAVDGSSKTLLVAHNARLQVLYLVSGVVDTKTDKHAEITLSLQMSLGDLGR